MADSLKSRRSLGAGVAQREAGSRRVPRTARGIHAGSLFGPEERTTSRRETGGSQVLCRGEGREEKEDSRSAQGLVVGGESSPEKRDISIS